MIYNTVCFLNLLKAAKLSSEITACFAFSTVLVFGEYKVRKRKLQFLYFEITTVANVEGISFFDMGFSFHLSLLLIGFYF